MSSYSVNDLVEGYRMAIVAQAENREIVRGLEERLTEAKSRYRSTVEECKKAEKLLKKRMAAAEDLLTQIDEGKASLLVHPASKPINGDPHESGLALPEQIEAGIVGVVKVSRADFDEYHKDVTYHPPTDDCGPQGIPLLS